MLTVSSGQITIRPMELADFDVRIAYFHDATDEHLGDEAHMHLHIVDPERRGSGVGTQCVRLTAAHLCQVFGLKHLYCEPNAFNVAPNRTLQKAGFKYLCSRECRPNPINTHQTTTIWVYAPARLT
jgi:RimJ/RimL family protein N-acetyltransferase